MNSEFDLIRLFLFRSNSLFLPIPISIMKRIFTLLLIIFTLTGYAQVSMESVLIETGTATWNNACANEVEILI